MASIGTNEAFQSLKRRVERLELWKRKAVKIMSDLSKQQDRLDADIPKLQQEEADEAAQLTASKQEVSDAKAALAEMTAQRDALQSSDKAAADRLTAQIDALEKLIPDAAAPAPPPADGSAPVVG